MHLTPEQKQIGRDNFNEAVAFTRREFLGGLAATASGLGATYFGYEQLKGERVKTAFIGTGDEGNVLITQHPVDYMEVVAIADLRPTNRRRAFHGDGNEHRVGLIKKVGAKAAKKIRVYKDHLELLKHEPDVELCVVAVPLNQHARVAIDCMRAGKHVLSEKLMAHSVRECKEIIRVARETKRLYAVGHQRHYSVLYDNANTLIRNGLLGDIKFIRASWHRNNSFPGRDSWRKPIPAEDARELEGKVQQYGYDTMNHLVNWRLYHKTGGGLMAELGSHQLDACSIFLGKVHPIAVQGYGGKNFYGVKGVGSLDKQMDDREIDDHVYVTFEFPGPHYEEDHDDIVIVTYSSINTNRLEPYGETVFGSRATLITQQEQEVLLFKEAGPSTGPGGLEQRLHVITGDSGQPVLDASESLAPSTQAAVAASTMQKVSRGYTEEMEHFCHCIRTNNYGPPEDGGLRCNGVVAMADAIMALTANLAMKHKKRVVFKPEWFDPDNPAVPEEDPEIIG
ncbi:MAG: gfo/Idh/MocA family oxidoreductase [Planctomycetota bacterium]|nr:MAG: gfo/Idh/MocA family oxidoreductase [Planctomycetota bacterium]